MRSSLRTAGFMRKYLSINQPQMKNQFYKSIQLAVVTWKLKNEKANQAL